MPFLQPKIHICDRDKKDTQTQRKKTMPQILNRHIFLCILQLAIKSLSHRVWISHKKKKEKNNYHKKSSLCFFLSLLYIQVHQYIPCVKHIKKKFCDIAILSSSKHTIIIYRVINKKKNVLLRFHFSFFILFLLDLQYVNFYT